MAHYLQLGGITLGSLLIIDYLWLGIVAQKMYRSMLGDILKTNPNFVAAGIFYILYACGLVFFVIQPALQRSSWVYALLAGAFFGVLAYGTYDLTNLATLSKWPIRLTIIDMAWGGIMTGTVAVISYHLGKALS